MSPEQLKRSIDDAIRMLEIYKREEHTKTASEQRLEESSRQQLSQSARILIKEAATMLLPAGQTCPRCGGSGSI
jgi:hypothetical protein